MKYLKHIIILAITTTLLACGAYSFTGGDVGEAKTFQVNYFQNNAQLIEPGLERDFTIALQDLIQDQTNLELVNEYAPQANKVVVIAKIIMCFKYFILTKKLNLQNIASLLQQQLQTIPQIKTDSP
jgi:hypothetical protein